MTPPFELLDRRSTRTDLDQAASALIDPDSIACPECGTGATQIPVYVGQDGALDRIDFACCRCGTEHPVWVG